MPPVPGYGVRNIWCLFVPIFGSINLPVSSFRFIRTTIRQFLVFSKKFTEYESLNLLSQRLSSAVILANAGIQQSGDVTVHTYWIPAFAGMTTRLSLVASNGCSKPSVVGISFGYGYAAMGQIAVALRAGTRLDTIWPAFDLPGS
jgi:hypothetical protein